MVVSKLSGRQMVDDYFSSLLSDTQEPGRDRMSDEPSLRFARVDRAHALAVFWQEPLTPHQVLCADLFLLSCLRTVSGQRLRAAMLSALRSFG